MNLPSLSQEADELERMVKTIEKCRSRLEKLPRDFGHIWWAGLSRRFYDVDFGPDLSLDEKRSLVQSEQAERKKRKDLIGNTIDGLREIGEIIQSNKNEELKTGRPKADSEKFGYAIGKHMLFDLSIGPTKTRGGLFVTILNIAWKALGRESQYQLAQVNTAVESINKHFPKGESS